MSESNPIGVFDSGLGGLTVVKALREKLPNESIVYFGDTARVPYGNKSPELIQKYSKQIVDFLLEHHVKMIVIACNTATALALPALQIQLTIPVIGVVKPGVQAALKATVNKHIGVIGTISTIGSDVYKKEVNLDDKSIEVTSLPCPLFVPLAEEGMLESPATKLIAEKYLKPINDAKVDTLILGCTHYPLLKSVIQSVVLPSTKLVDSAEAVAAATAVLLEQNKLSSQTGGKGKLKLYVSDFPARFKSVAERFLGEKIKNVTKVQLD